MNKYLLPWLYISLVTAETLPQEKCGFVIGWARQAMHIANKVGLPEESWIITEDGFEVEEYKVIMQIKHEAYHDVKALTRRVELACSKKEES